VITFEPGTLESRSKA